jgi:hypothetical protein
LPKKKQSNLDKAAVLSMIALGAATLIISTFYTSSFLAILGFAIIFWGTILLYTTPTKHVFFELLNAAAEPSSANIERILAEYSLNQKGIYLPPNPNNAGLSNGWSLLQNTGSSLVFIPETSNLPLPKPEENSPRPKNSGNGGIYITPPGQGLCKIFEQQAGKSFTKIDLRQLQSILPRIIIKDLELAETVDIKTEENIITIEITKSILEQICQETSKNQPRTHKQLGCLLTSAIACALAKVTGEPITI